MKKILIAGVKKANAGYLDTLLQLENISVSIVKTGKQTIDVVSSELFQLVLIDLNLSGKVLNTIRKIHSYTALPVLVLTTEKDEKKIIELYEQGANEVITKPFSEALLKIKVENLLKVKAQSEKIIEQNKMLGEVIDNIPILTVIVNNDVRVLNTNKAFSEQIEQYRLNFRDELLGNVVRCMHAIESKGNCGKTPNCKGCVVRNSVNETFETGKNIGRREGIFNIKVNNSIKELTLKVSTTSIEYEGVPSVLLFIDDITTETQHLKEIEETKEQYHAQSEKLAELLDKLNEANHKLEESQNLFRLIADYGYNWETYRDKTGKVVYCSPAVERLLGYTVEEYTLGVPPSDFIHPDDLEHAMADMKRVSSGETISSCVFRIIHSKSKEIVWLDASGQPLISTDGEILGVRFSLRDITQLKKTERSLQESEARYKLISDYSYSWETYRKPTGELVYCSPGVERLLGYTPEEYILDEKLFQIIYRVDYPIFESAYKRMLAGETIHSVTYRLVKKSGDIIWADISAQPVYSETNKLLGTRISIKDVTRLKEIEQKLIESEENYKEAEAIAHIGHFDTDIVHGSVIWSDELYRIFEIDPEKSEITFDSFINTVHPEDRALVIETHRKSLLHENTDELQFRLLFGDGSMKYVTTRYKTTYNTAGEPVRSFGLNKDITEQVLAENALTKYAEELKELNATKDKFFSIISHDLKSPFNSMIGFSELLLGNLAELTAEEVNEFITNINTTAKKTFELLENLLTWARSQSGKISINQQKIKLKGLTHDVISMLQQAASNKTINLVNLTDPDICVYADKNMLQTIIRNLISNSIKYTKKNGIITTKAEIKGDFAVVSVVDTGMGMDDATKLSLFKLAETKSRPGTANEKGTGLGLILCKEFVGKNGGKIWVESELGKGSTFNFTIPLGINL